MKKSTFKRVISFTIALMMILFSTQGFLAEASTYTENDIVLTKTATPVGENTYDIQLSVKGKDIVTGKKADVILVIDNSNSMHDTKYGGKTLAQITKDAANAFIDGVLTTANDSTGNVRVAVVQYGTYAKAYQFTSNDWTNNWRNNLTVNGDKVFTSDITKAKSAIGKATTKFSDSNYGGTNTEGGFLMASKVASVKRDSADSIVVFMTDGMPTFRYDSDGYAERDSGFFLNGGIYTSKKELNEAIAAAQSLGKNGKIYTVALLSAFSKNSNEAKLASYLLSLLPKTYNSDNDTKNIMPHVNKSRWKATASYAEKYYPIFSEDNASDEMQDIYSTLAGAINALANGYVTDIIPKDFELTEESRNALALLGGIEVTDNEDGTTTIVFSDVSASGTETKLPKFSVKVNPGVYGTGFTNKEAYYTYTLYGEDEESEPKYFENPIVPINPIANDDNYSVYQDDVLNVPITNGILQNDETMKLEEGEYSVSDLVVMNSYLGTITTSNGGSVELYADGSFVYTPSEGFTGDDTFIYQNIADVLGDGPLANEYESNEALVKIAVLPIGSNVASYKTEHYVQNADFATYSLRETVKGNGIIGDTVQGEPIDYKGYEHNSDIEGTILSGVVSADEILTLKLYYDAKPFNVYYNPNGGTGEMADENNPYIYGEEVVVLDNEFVNDGYKFIGWGYIEQTIKPMSVGDEYSVIYDPDDTFDMPESDVVLYALWEEEADLIPYVVRYLEQESNIELDRKEGSGNAGDIIKEYAVDIDGYTAQEPIELELELKVDGDNTITFWYVKDTVPEEPENFITIKHYTKTGTAQEVLAKTETKPNPVTTGSALIYGADYKDDSIISEGFEYQNSTPESIEVFADATSQTAIEYLFELRYYKEGSSGGDPGGDDPGGGSPGGGSGGGTIIPDNEIPLAELEKIDHFAYIIGYPEGDIRPLNKITREEVAMIFYRLLTDESRDALLSDTNSFTDVEDDRWSNRAISTLYNADIISGYPDGTFKPSEPITRAEFATIAAKFDELELGGTSKFTDISGHWAEDYIISSELKGWINGYPDFTFRPEQDITRAESMTLINNVLERKVPEENIHPDAMFWPDNPKEEWYYEAIMEATNSHDYIIEEDGDELWTGMKPNKVWP